MMTSFDIPPYLSFLPQSLLESLWEEGEPVEDVPGLRVALD